MSLRQITRREALRLCGGAGAAVGVLGVLDIGCKKEPSFACLDTTGLTPDEVQARTTLAYVDTATEPGRNCVACQQYVAPPSGSGCGTCKVLKGPVHPQGGCKVFSAKT